MNTTQIIGIVIAALVILGGIWYFVAGNNATEEPQVKLSDGSFSGSFFDLATRGGNYKCDMATDGTNNASTGTVYVSGTDVRGDFVSTSGGTTIESHMIKKGEDMYVWSSSLAQGMKMKATVAMSDASAQTTGQGVNGSQSYSWECSATGADAAKFTIPTDVEFMDISAMGSGQIPVPTGQMPY